MTHRTKVAIFADGILVMALIFCLAVFSYAVARRTGAVDGGWRPGLLLYAGVAFLGFVAVGASLTLRESWRMNIALVLLSLALSIYLAEILLFFAGPTENVLAEIVRSAGLQFDARTKYQVVEDLRLQGVDAVPAILPHDLFVHEGFNPEAAGILPVAGISGKTTVLCNESGYYSIYTADEHGFNNPRGLLNAGALDIALIGDSFVHGFCVHPGEDIAGQLRTAGLRVISLGMGGNGPLLELATLTEYAARNHPKIVLWLYFENDQPELLEEVRSPILRKYLRRGFSQNLRKRQPEIDKILTDFAAERQAVTADRSPGNNDVVARPTSTVVELLKLYHLRSFLLERLRPPMTTPLLPPGDEFRNVLATAQARVRAMNSRLCFVYLPSLNAFSGSPQEYRTHRDQVLAVVTALGIDVLDFLQQIDRYPGDPVQLFAPKRPSHYSVVGYAFLRDAIVAHLGIK